jgi:sugar/nucleoside kinase (ribokinase family)
LTGCDDLQKAFAYFKTDQTIVATDGANGCWVKMKGEKHAVHYETIKVTKVVNKTGAGDIWAGIYLAFALKGLDVKICVEMANRGAAEWIQQKPGTYLDEKIWELFRNRISINS